MSALYFYAKNGYNIKYDCGSAKRGTIRYQKKIKVRGETMYTCAKCGLTGCRQRDLEKTLPECPSKNSELQNRALKEYENE